MFIPPKKKKRERERRQEGTLERVLHMSVILIAVIVSYVSACSQTHQLNVLNMYSSLYINSTSIRLFNTSKGRNNIGEDSEVGSFNNFLLPTTPH